MPVEVRELSWDFTHYEIDNVNSIGNIHHAVVIHISRSECKCGIRFTHHIVNDAYGITNIYFAVTIHVANSNRRFDVNIERFITEYMPLSIAIHQPILLMKLSEGAVGFHLGNDGVDKGEKIVLPLAHQHTDFSVGEGSV